MQQFQFYVTKVKSTLFCRVWFMCRAMFETQLCTYLCWASLEPDPSCPKGWDLSNLHSLRCFLPLRKGAVALHFIQKCPFPVDRDKPQETCISFSCAKYDRKESLGKEVQHKTLGSTNCKFILSILHGLNSLQGCSSCWEVRSLGNKDPWETDPSVLQVYSTAGKQPVSWSLEMNEIFLYYLI